MDLFDCFDNPLNGFEISEDNLHFMFSYPKNNYKESVKDIDLDKYIITHIQKYDVSYFSFLFKENLWLKKPKNEWSKLQEQYFQYLSTYTKLYFILDNWNHKYMYNLVYLSEITPDDKNIIGLLSHTLNKKEMFYWIKNIVYPIFNNYILKNVGYSLDSEILLGNISIIQFVLECLNYPLFINNIDNKEIFTVNTQNNLLGYLFVCLNVKNTKYDIYISEIYDKIVFMMKNGKKDIITEWISILINNANNRVQLNYDYLDTLNNSNDNKMINVMNILLLLWKGGNGNKERIRDISTNYIKSKHCILKWKDEISKSQLDNYVEDESIYINYLNKCFFILHRCTYVTLTPLFLSYDYYYKKFKDIETYLKILNVGETQVSSLIITRLERWSSTYFNRLKSIEKKIVNYQTNTLIKIFIEDTSFWINNLINDNKLDDIQSIPDSLYYMIIDYINFYINYSHLNDKQIEIMEELINLVYKIIGTSEYIKNPNLKCKMFNSILCNKESIEFISIHKKFDLKHSRDTLILNILNLYNSIEHIHNKIYTRYNIVWFLSNIITENILFFNSLYKNEQVYDKFIFIFISELNSIYDILLKYYKILSNQDNHLNYIEVSKYHEVLKTYTEYFTSYIKLLSTLMNCEYCNKNFLKDIIIDKFTNSLIYIMNNFSINFTDNNNLIPERYLENIKKIIIHFIFIFRNVYHNDKFLKSFSREDTIYNEKLTKKFLYFMITYEPIIKVNLWSEYKTQITNFDHFIVHVNDLIRKEIKIPDEDIPDEFLDPIMSTLIKNPVIIPNTNNTFMDKNVIYKYLVTESKNPFTREKLNKKILDEFNLKPEIADLNNKLKIKIDNWLDEYLSLKKNDVSNIKKLVIKDNKILKNTIQIVQETDTDTDTDSEGTGENENVTESEKAIFTSDSEDVL